MTEQTRTAPAFVAEHAIGDRGTLVVLTAADDVVVRGVDGDVARLVSPQSDEALAELTSETGPNRFSIQAGPGVRGTSFGLGRMLAFDIGGRHGGRLELEVPRHAVVEVTTTSGRVRLDDLAGSCTVATVSGEVELHHVAASRVKTASGRVSVEADAPGVPIRVDVGTISGRVAVSAPLVAELAIRTMSGRVALEAGLAGGTAHAIESLSGRIHLALLNGATVTARTISGRIRCEPPLEVRETAAGATVVVGDGSARLTVRTASGHVGIAGQQGSPDDVAARQASAGPDAPTTPAPAQAVPPPAPRADGGQASGRLAILEALERGELDVEEALRRLDLPGGEPSHA